MISVLSDSGMYEKTDPMTRTDELACWARSHGRHCKQHNNHYYEGC